MRTIAFAWSTILVIACGTNDPNKFHDGCDHISSLEVTAGPTPDIDWSPDCAVNTITVHQALTPEDPGSDPLPVGQTMWEIHATEVAGNTIEPSVRYGEVPPGIIEGSPPLPLTVGQTYIVSVGTVSLSGPGVGRRLFFTP
ncbi:MAG TPA: hypothetical protein VEB59_15715 [Gemmatimonadales bacterium]|nr:hypothetical protein [Gemmatimonadales bacterium]